MGEIADKHVEWAVVNRLKAMLDEPPKTKFNVTQSFALFSTVLMWTKNRIWVAGNRGQRRAWKDLADHQAHDARELLRRTLIVEDPWCLSMAPPQIALIDHEKEPHRVAPQINADFAEMTAEVFFKWLRDALAHGDGRTIRPIHKPSARGNKTLLAGFQIVFAEANGSDRSLTLALYHADMRRVGAILADLFCQSLAGGDHYFEEDIATRIEEPAA